MATTTNYGWTTPNDTDLVKDGASAIRSLGSSVDTTVKALNPETTLGDIAYRSSTANTKTRLAIGSTGQVLTVSGGVPVWAAPAGGGKVLQVVSATTTTSASTTSTTFADTGLTASITPSATTSKILVLFSQFCGKTGDASTTLRLFRGATQISEILYIGDTASTLSQNLGYSFQYLDSPSSTSSLTYKTQYASGGGGGTAFVQRHSNISSIILLEIGA